MREIKIEYYAAVPKNFTGIAKTESGNKFWLKNGQHHRTDGPAIEKCTGSRFWYINNKLHRLDGPAFINFNGIKQWFQHGKLHRLDGPAIEYPVAGVEYFINDVHHSKKDFDRKTKLIQKQLSKRNTEYKHLTDEQWHEYLDILVLE